MNDTGLNVQVSHWIVVVVVVDVVVVVVFVVVVVVVVFPKSRFTFGVCQFWNVPTSEYNATRFLECNVVKAKIVSVID